MGCLFVISVRLIDNDAFLLNQIIVGVNKAIGLSDLDYETRVNYFIKADTALSSLLLLENNTLHTIDIEVEKAALFQAKEFLDTSENYAYYEPTVQLLNNPEFNNGKAGWTEYSSSWQNQIKTMLGEHNSILTYSREGIGHSSISQILFLKSGQCYLFSVVGTVERYDEIPTIWLYWETYDTGKPVGNSLISSPAEQPWQRRNGVFCLSPSNTSIQKIVVAPINIYGTATVYLDSARLYELRKRN